MKKVNPALKHLAPFIGEWDMKLSHAAFLPDPKSVIHGSVFFEWVEDGAFIVMRQGKEATWLIGRDEKNDDYTILYSDARGVSRVYEMSLGNNLWKIWRHSPGFSQRYEAKIGKDKKSIDARWEKSTDGKTWEHDFDMKYRKLS